MDFFGDQEKLFRTVKVYDSAISGFRWPLDGPGRVQKGANHLGPIVKWARHFFLGKVHTLVNSFGVTIFGRSQIFSVGQQIEIHDFYILCYYTSSK